MESASVADKPPALLDPWLAKIGHKVLVLRRIAMGPLRLGELPVGAHRPLTRDEVRALEDLPPLGEAADA